MSVPTTQLTQVDVVPGSATSTAAAATVNTQTGVITTEALTTGPGATYTFTLTNALINAGSIVLMNVGKGTATAGLPAVAYLTAGAGTAVALITNTSSTTALNGTIKIGFAVFNMS